MFKKKYSKKEEGILIFDHSDDTAKKVKNFYKDDPFPNYEISDNKASIVSKGNKNSYTLNLKKFIGHNKKIIEIGAGTSQLSNYLAVGNNNSITAFDVNFESLKIGSIFAKKNQINNLDFVCGDIFDNIFEDNIFDIVICNGVLHHTKDTFAAFQESLKWLKKDGFILLGLYNRYGRTRTFFRKYIYKIFGKKYLMLFDPVLRKINKDSKPKIDAWIKDQYTHPVERTHTFDDVIKWFDLCDVEFINSFPSCEFLKDFSNEKIFENLFVKGSKGSLIERILNQLFMIFTRQGSEGGLYLFLGKKK
jgi:2-polyprenyl-3-methyl-5-hydroxy-6-metoxy-1,4-benzoquinol methylase